MAEKTESCMLTEGDLNALAQVGVMMCTDMIDAAGVADLFAVMGMGDAMDPAQRVTPQTTKAWVAIANEYMEALDELTANGTL